MKLYGSASSGTVDAINNFLFRAGYRRVPRTGVMSGNRGIRIWRHETTGHELGVIRVSRTNVDWEGTSNKPRIWPATIVSAESARRALDAIADPTTRSGFRLPSIWDEQGLVDILWPHVPEWQQATELADVKPLSVESTRIAEELAQAGVKAPDARAAIQDVLAPHVPDPTHGDTSQKQLPWVPLLIIGILVASVVAVVVVMRE